jgi:hypothetical protein
MGIGQYSKKEAMKTRCKQEDAKDGTVKHENLKGKVQVSEDKDGLPSKHIYS